MHLNTPLSMWNLSELLTWSDFNFIDNSDQTDVENYCSFIGAYDICTMFRGVVPVVHGPLSCVSSYYSTRIATRLKEKIKPLPFATCMDASDVIFGAAEKLRKVIKDTDQLYHPKLIVILTTCVSDMIAEDVSSLIRKIKDDIDADLLLMTIGGISCKGFREGADYAFKKLMEYVKEKNPMPAKNHNSINLFLRRINGKLSEENDLNEMIKMLDVNGIKINTVIRLGTSYDELMKIPQAQANVSLCFTYGKEVMKYMQDIFCQQYSSVSYPIGISGTKKWVNNITQILGLKDKFSVSPEVREAEIKFEKLKTFLADKVKTKQMFIWHAGEKALAFVKLANDLGLEPVIVGLTYHLLKINRETIISLLDEGYDPKVIIRGYAKLWAKYEKAFSYYERPVMFAPKKLWSGNFPCADIDLFRDCAVGLSGIENIIETIYKCYTRKSLQNFSAFDRYIERLYEEVKWD